MGYQQSGVNETYIGIQWEYYIRKPIIDQNGDVFLEFCGKNQIQWVLEEDA